MAETQIQVATGDELAQLKALLQSVSSTRIRRFEDESALRGTVLSLKLEGTEDASQHAPRSTPSHPSPRLVSWSPDGRYLVTACGAWGCTFWACEGGSLASRWRYHPKSCYGEPQTVIWSRSGNRFLLLGSTARCQYVEIYESSHGHSADHTPRMVADNSFTSSLYGYLHKIDVPAFEPWRPGSTDLLVPDGDTIALVDESLIERERDTRATSLAGFLIDLVRSRPAKAPPSLRNARKSSTSLGLLGARDKYPTGFAWHPSGQYLALTTEEIRSDGESNKVHIIHFDSSKIVTSLPDVAARGWNGGGGLLLLETSNKAIRVWDACSDSTREATQHERASTEFARTVSSIESGYKANARGDLMLGPGSGAYDVIRCSDRTSLFSLPEGIKWTAWSPTDPLCFATVGGRDSPNSLRLWRVSSEA